MNVLLMELHGRTFFMLSLWHRHLGVLSLDVSSFHLVYDINRWLDINISDRKPLE